MIISLIAAVSENGVIGSDNDLPWHLPADLKYFKRTTLGHPIIMGRKTFESFGGRPLPKRRNLVLTRDTTYSVSGAEVFTSLDQALNSCSDEDEVFICGGAQIYELAFPRSDRLYLTEIHATVKGDTQFPDFNKDDWELCFEYYREKDEKNCYSMTWKHFHRV